MQTSHMFIDVVPIRRLPPSLSFFTYSVPPPLQKIIRRGSLVEIPFKNGVLAGVVTGMSQSTDLRKIRAVSRVIPLSLTKQQVECAEYCARYYHQSLGLVFNSFIPVTRQKKWRAKENAAEFKGVGGITVRASKMSENAVIKDGYVIYAHSGDFIALLLKLIGKKHNGGQVLIVVPEAVHREIVVEVLRRQNLLSVTCIIPPRTNERDYLSAWHRSAQSSIILGSLMSLMMPFNNLRQIIVFESEHPGFMRAEQNPRYHLADIANACADIYQSHILYTGFSPDIVLLDAVRKKNHSVRKMGTLSKQPIIISTKNEKPLLEQGIFSSRVIEAINSAQGPVLIICNRHGFARSVACKDCGFRIACPDCGKPFVYANESDMLRCYSCGRLESLQAQCIRCGGSEMSMRGIGLSRVAGALRQVFGLRKIVEFSSEKKTLDKIDSTMIVVATNAIFSRQPVFFDVSCMVNPDVDLHRPTLHAAETLRHYILKLSSFSGKLFIQTQNEDHYLYTTLNDVGAFYSAEIQWRKTFLYPPYGTIYKFIVRNSSRTIYTERLKTLQKLFADLQFFGPFETRQKNSYVGSVIVKVALGESLPNLDALLRTPYTWFHVEVNPYDLT